MRIAGNGDAKPLAENDELADAEVPAAVVCAHCGDADCPGCPEEETRSGVVAVVAWERPGTPALGRLWATARATTLDAERFFESLPDGPIAPALRFAVASEMLAAAAMATIVLIPISMAVPGWLHHLLFDETAAALRLAAAGVPGLALILVAAHVAHGWALDRGARRSGASPATIRAVRFGLYAAGWDLVIGPLGIAILLAKEGGRAALSVASVGIGLPGRSARAFLHGAYRLEGEAARPALRASYVAAGLSTILGAMAVIAGIVVALLS
ncbi:MAG: hypothetical protein M3O46_04250 [Myxococcota bacterium]|nr:hypothetical protein [Myxococcota bacterium]